MSKIGDLHRQLADQFDAIYGPTVPPVEPPPPIDPPPPPVEPPPVDPPPPVEPPPTGTRFATLPDAVAGQAITGTPPSPLPALGKSFTDPMSKLPITRASDGTARHNYSRRQAWNADESRYLTFIVNDGHWQLRDAKTCAVLKVLPVLAGDDCEPLWHPTDPKLLWHYIGLKWYALNVETGVDTLLFDLTGRLPAWAAKATNAWTKSEGSASDSGDTLFLMLTSYDPKTYQVPRYGMVCVNPMTGKIYGSRQDSTSYDHCGTSHSGRWGVYSSEDPNVGSVAWSRDFKTSKKIITSSQHSDFAIGVNGKDDMYVYAQFRTADDNHDGVNEDGWLMANNLDTGEVIPLLGTYISATSSYTSYHISGRASACPGYVVVSAYKDNVGAGGKLGEIYRRVCIVELKADGLRKQVTPTRQNLLGYFDEPQATCNRDLTKIMFASAMGGSVTNSWIVDVPK